MVYRTGHVYTKHNRLISGRLTRYSVAQEASSWEWSEVLWVRLFYQLNWYWKYQKMDLKRKKTQNFFLWLYICIGLLSRFLRISPRAADMQTGKILWGRNFQVALGQQYIIWCRYEPCSVFSKLFHLSPKGRSNRLIFLPFFRGWKLPLD